MDHVRANLASPLSLDALAKLAHFSPHHFHRVFKARTGETLTAFVQRARLERAAYLMMSSPERRLDSIALEVGFSAHSDFTRVFKKHYGVAPSEWDRESRLDPGRVTDDYEAMLAKARAEREPPEIRVVEQPARALLYIRTRTPFIGEPVREGYARLTSYLEERGVDYRRETLLGWSWDNYETTPLENVCCDIGFTLPEGEPLEAVERDGYALGVQRFEAHTAVQARARGEMIEIALAWDALYQDWLPSSRHEPGELPAYKVFERRPDEIGWDEWDVWCSLALVP